MATLSGLLFPRMTGGWQCAAEKGRHSVETLYTVASFLLSSGLEMKFFTLFQHAKRMWVQVSMVGIKEGENCLLHPSWGQLHASLNVAAYACRFSCVKFT